MLNDNIAGDLIPFIDEIIKEKFGSHIGLCIFTFEFNRENPLMTWASNVQRQDAITALLEWIFSNSPELITKCVERLNNIKTIGSGKEKIQ